MKKNTENFHDGNKRILLYLNCTRQYDLVGKQGKIKKLSFNLRIASQCFYTYLGSLIYVFVLLVHFGLSASD